MAVSLHQPSLPRLEPQPASIHKYPTPFHLEPHKRVPSLPLVYSTPTRVFSTSHLSRMHVVAMSVARRATSSTRHAAPGPPFPPSPTDTTIHVRAFPEISGRRASTSLPPPPPPNDFPFGHPYTGCGGGGGGGGAGRAATVLTSSMPMSSSECFRPALSPSPTPALPLLGPGSEVAPLQAPPHLQPPPLEILSPVARESPPPPPPLLQENKEPPVDDERAAAASPTTIASKLFQALDAALGRAEVPADALVPRFPAGLPEAFPPGLSSEG